MGSASGGLMLAAIMPINRILSLNPTGHKPFLDAATRDLGVPPAIADLVSQLLAPAHSARPTLDHVIQVLDRDHAIEAPTNSSPEPNAEELTTACDSMASYIRSVMSIDRQDRLFPSAPEVFTTNPLSVAFGAAGVLCALKASGVNDTEAVEWLLRRPITPATYPPGLYVGLSGIAWTLLELDRPADAQRILRLADGHPLLDTSPDVFYGLAGWGLTQLKFFLATGDEYYLDQARSAGERLLGLAAAVDGECSYVSQGATSTGFGHGVAGIAVFFLYLFCATGDERFLTRGTECMAFAYARVRRTRDGAWTWRAREGEPAMTPYWRWGTAGVGMAALRYDVLTGDEQHRVFAERALTDVHRKFTIFPGRFFGLAGLGEYCLDLEAFGVCADAAKTALATIVDGISLFKLERPGGVCFPGETLARISCDFGTGSAGILAFMCRVLHRQRALYMLDELLLNSDSMNRAPQAESTVRTGLCGPTSIAAHR